MNATNQHPTKEISRPQIVDAGSAYPHKPEKSFVKDRAAAFRALITPFSKRDVNNKLLALCSAQALCSVATLIHDTYLPVYLQDVLGLSNTKIGNLQALAQFLSNMSKSISGTLADLLTPARMVIFGTLLTTINKPMFALSGAVYATYGTVATVYWVTAGKVFDRMSKGIREAPSKALIGDLATESGDKAEGAFGLRQAMATFGALIGASIAGLAFQLSGQNYIITFALSTVPAVAALLLTLSTFGTSKDKSLAKEVKEASKEAEPISLKERIKGLLSALQPAYWQALLVVSLLYFARFDASFITLRAKTILPKSQLPLLMSTVMVLQAVLSAPSGLQAKKSLAERNKVLLLGYAAMIGADLCFAMSSSAAGMFAGAALVGVHMAMTHGVTLAMVASYIPTKEVPGIGKISGTCWSFTDFVFGIILAYSNSVAGRLSDMSARQFNAGNIGCFVGGSVATILSGLALLIFTRFGSLGREDAIVSTKRKAA
ncbi:hypothetical protein WJX73_000936 [Symbiochloris irregularis]|uniref:MFS transporter n=1 Tax=Symbiochloris irregularis TaxID=706552 RepID=A0AAW1NYI8_9CHLO